MKFDVIGISKNVVKKDNTNYQISTFKVMALAILQQSHERVDLC